MFESTVIDISTIKVLDNYIKSKEQYFRISDGFNISYNNEVYNIYFIISNKIPIEKTIVKTNITMTEFKKIYDSYFNTSEKYTKYKTKITDTDRTSIPKLSVPVLDFIELFFNHLSNNIATNYNKDGIILFDNPISINAQSSDNRTGYGNEYYYSILVYEGKKYGETSEFPIVGYQIRKLE